MGWRPMKTLPNDGRVELRARGGEVYTATCAPETFEVDASDGRMWDFLEGPVVFTGWKPLPPPQNDVEPA